ncbi:hypothetical protein F4553_007589 [Allocatelliglobosispora scoriae]|uniref:Ferric siderophore reductase C-terminal domain-containing protein n=1 Tax=Allocatelliglobosispora scoriae TaxID=643052 RepID=A0A841C2L3_9ACTN|nr:(2Fe-2S)-binding protein [Allocatelliglobosispora scoriae]MBB5874155.1 hypothetical protein [Allocatelliglobosispora scoriae]
MPDTLAATLASLHLDTGFRLVAGPPDGPDWFGLDEIAADPVLVTRWLDDLRGGEACGRTDVAAVSLVTYLVSAVADPLTIAVCTLRQGWSLPPGSLAVHRHPDGWFDGLAVADPSTVVPVEAEGAVDGLSAQLVALFRPVFDLIRERTRLGRPVMWGALGDTIAGAAVDNAREAGTDARVAWRSAAALIDGIARLVPQVRARRSPATVEWSGGTAVFVNRGVCCLYYRVASAEECADGGGNCTHCPLRSPDDRVRRWAAYLEEERSGH